VSAAAVTVQTQLMHFIYELEESELKDEALAFWAARRSSDSDQLLAPLVFIARIFSLCGN